MDDRQHFPLATDPTRRGFRVRVTKDYLQFCAAHLISQENGSWEPLHGHNYRVTVTLYGGLQKHAAYVFDFVALKALMRRLVNELDHRVILAQENPLLIVSEAGPATIHLTVPDGGVYTFPRRDVCLLPIPNTTAEALAYYLSGRIRAELPTAPDLTGIEVEVEETPGQSATYFETWTQ